MDKRDNQNYEKARKHVQKVKDFWSHFSIWLIVSLFLFGINYFTSPQYWWAMWPFAAWGLAVALNALDVFGLPGMGKNWEDRMIAKEMRRMERQKDRIQLLQSRNSLSEDEELELKELIEETPEYREEDLV